MHFLAGVRVTRGCIGLHDEFPDLQSNGFEGFPEDPEGRQFQHIAQHYCNTDLCNRTGRLVDVSTMMILLPASLVLIKYNIDIYNTI